MKRIIHDFPSMDGSSRIRVHHRGLLRRRVTVRGHLNKTRLVRRVDIPLSIRADSREIEGFAGVTDTQEASAEAV